MLAGAGGRQLALFHQMKCVDHEAAIMAFLSMRPSCEIYKVGLFHYLSRMVDDAATNRASVLA